MNIYPSSFEEGKTPACLASAGCCPRLPVLAVAHVCWRWLLPVLAVAYFCHHWQLPVLAVKFRLVSEFPLTTMARLLVNHMWWGWLGALVSERQIDLISSLLSTPPRGRGRRKGDLWLPVAQPSYPSGEKR